MDRTSGLQSEPKALYRSSGETCSVQIQSLDRKTPDKAQATPSPELSETSTTQAATDDDPQDLPELIHGESMSPPDMGELHSIDDLCLSQDVLQKELFWKLQKYTSD